MPARPNNVSMAKGGEINVNIKKICMELFSWNEHTVLHLTYSDGLKMQGGKRYGNNHAERHYTEARVSACFCSFP